MNTWGCYCLFANVVILAVKDAKLAGQKRTESGDTIDPVEAQTWLKSADCAAILEWLNWPVGYLEVLRKRENLRLVFPTEPA